MKIEGFDAKLEALDREKASASHHLVYFLPYLRLEACHSVAGLDFVPFRDANGSVPRQLEKAESALSKILSSYIDKHGKPYENCVVATIPDRGWDLKRTDGAAVCWAVSLLFLASWAQNQYFPRFLGHYANSSSFRIVGQEFAGEKPAHMTIGARRRDGITWDAGYTHGELHFNTPVQCRIGHAFAVDEPFLAALNKAHTEGSATLERLRTSLPFVQLAHTDDDVVTEDAEAILMASAFEQLLNGNGSKYELAKALGQLFERFGNENVASARKVRPDIEINRSKPEYADAQPEWWVHRKWFEELYSLRNKLAHQGDQGTRTWGWHPSEHLVMAAFVFPLAVKLFLSQEDHYPFNSVDEAHCKAIDKLLAVIAWDEERQGADSGSVWHNIVEKAVQDHEMEKLMQQFLEEHPVVVADKQGGKVAP